MEGLPDEFLLELSVTFCESGVCVLYQTVQFMENSHLSIVASTDPKRNRGSVHSAEVLLGYPQIGV